MPACREVGCEVVEVVVELPADGPGRVEVAAGPGVALAGPHLERGAALHDSLGQHLADDDVGDEALDSVRGAAPAACLVPDASLERGQVAGFVGHGVSPPSRAMTDAASMRRMSPRSAASLAASSSRSGITIPMESTSARATVVQGMPS